MNENKCIKIQWKGLKPESLDSRERKATPLDVVEVLIERLKYEQGTEGLASDKNARALAHLLLAKQELEGKRTELKDGTPVIE